MRQYYQPPGNLNVGDCMPFWHDGTFHFYYLRDEGHHGGKGGLGGHQWAHSSTRDLVHWDAHPLALAAEADWEASICTGSTFYHQGSYHAFYAVRHPDWSQHFGYAVGTDGIHFHKLPPPAELVPPADYARNDFRDPFVFEHPTGTFHLLITSNRENPPLHDRGGCLLRFTSRDLKSWQPAGVFLAPDTVQGGNSIPECPDHFYWNGWYYLIFGQGLRTYYRMSRDPLGPWLLPAVSSLAGGRCAVMKTALFGADRRIGVGWIGPCEGKDGTWMRWGGQAVFREMVQCPDGTLGMKFPPEMVPGPGERLDLDFQGITAGAAGSGGRVEIDAGHGMEVGYFTLPTRDVRFRCRIVCGEHTAAFGLGLRGSGRYAEKYELRLDLHRRTATLAGETLALHPGPGTEWTLDVIVQGDIIDVCVNEQQCLIHRLHELDGDRLFLFCEDGTARFEDIRIDALPRGN